MTDADLCELMRADASACNAALRINGQQTIGNIDTVPMVLRHLSSGHSRSKDIAIALGCRPRVLNSRLFYMRGKGVIARIARGFYAITEKGREMLEKEGSHG